MAIVENVMSLHSIAVFKGLSGEAIRQLEQSSVPMEPRDGEAIFSQGDPSDAVYAITGGDGHVRSAPRSTQQGADGRGPPRWRDIRRVRCDRWPRPVDNGHRGGQTSADENPPDDFSRRPRELPHGRRIALPNVGTTMAADIRIVPGCYVRDPGSPSRAADRYLAASEGRPTPQGVRLTHRLRQADLADLLGATTRSIITILNAWRAAGLVVYDTERAFLTVTDIAAMRAIRRDQRAATSGGPITGTRFAVRGGGPGRCLGAVK